MKVVEVMRAGQ